MALDEKEIAPANRERYTLDGDTSVEARINRDQELVAEAVQAILEPPGFRALVLMGGYGRGEGGYVTTGGGPAPYNDYDYFVVVRGVDRAQRDAFNRSLVEQAKALEISVGVEVDFALLHEERLPSAEYSLMNAEMIWGHRVVAGDQDVLDTMPAMPFGRLPAGEFTRLMLNRGALLLMNQDRLDSAEPGAVDQEVFFKYLFKAVLACGDTRLAGMGFYHPSYPRKLELLQAMDWPGSAAFMDLYQQAWEHKFHPDYGRFADEDAAAWQQQVVSSWLDTLSWFEEKRTGKKFAGWDAYCSPGLPKGQGGSSRGGLRNLAITLRDFGPVELLARPLWSLRYPRERLISVLPMLLENPGQGVTLAENAAGALALPAGTPWHEAVETFLRLWHRYA
jgi:hypothetical protein